jgi:hypothetical protein
MYNSYRKPSFTVAVRVIFDASNHKHMLDYARFVKYNNWKNGCNYLLEDPYLDIPTMIRAKVVDYRLSQYMKDV